MTAVMDAAFESRRTGPNGLEAPASPLSDRVIVEFSAAEDVVSGMERAVQLLRRAGGVNRVEWWAAGAHAAGPRLEAADGPGGGRRESVQIGDAGTLFVEGDWWSGELAAAVMRLAPIVRRRCAEERLAVRAGRIVRQNEALEDFAAVVAHELKAPLNAALLGADAADAVRSALGLVDSLLEAARSESAAETSSRVCDCLSEVLTDIHPVPARVATGDLDDDFPLPAGALRLVLRNLVSNAVSAGATRIGVRTTASSSSHKLVVEDDGVGLDGPEAAAYSSGSGLGLGLSKRIVARFGGTLGLEPRVAGGARAVLEIPRRRP
jgi:signal transduction histidine kinase